MIDISGHLREQRNERGYEEADKFLIVNCCGYQKLVTKNFSRVRENGRLDFQIIYVTDGAGDFVINGKTESVYAGNIVVYRPGEPQSYTYLCENAPEVYWVHFTGNMAADFLGEAGFGEGNVFSVGHSNTCIELFKKIILELQIKNPLFVQSANAQMMALIAHLGRRRNEHSAGRSKYDLGMQKVLQEMHSNYSQNFGIDDFARLCSLSRYRFMHKFRAYTGMSPIQYLTKIRIDKAKEFLIDSSLNITEIANVLGYENALYFSRVFKKATGVPPTEFRRE